MSCAPSLSAVAVFANWLLTIDFDPCQRDLASRRILQVKRRIGISVCRGCGDKTVGRGEYARELFLEQEGSSVSCRIVTCVRGSREIGIS